MRWYIIALMVHQIFVAPARSDDFVFSGGAPLDTYQPLIVVPLLTEAFKRAGHSFKAIHYPSLRSLKSSNSGKTDGELHRVFQFHQVSKGKYHNLIRIESELIRTALGIFTQKNNAAIGAIDDLAGYRIALKRGRLKMTARLAKLPDPTVVIPVSSDLASLRMLARGKFDFAVMEFNEGNAIISSSQKFNKIYSAARLSESRIFAFMHKRHGKLAKVIAANLEQMKTEGLFQNIVARSIKDFNAILAKLAK